MSNHVHSLIAFKETGKSSNNRIGTLKRFLAYELIEKLKAMGQTKILNEIGYECKLYR
jgi:hypothetical protein